MDIKRAGSQASGKGPADWFTGTVRIDPLFSPPDPARVAGALVTFEPGARTAWHTHPLGQTLIVMTGLGLVQREGGPIEEIRPGDVVWFPPGEKHWHGASPDHSHDPHRDSGGPRRQGRGLDGARHRRTVPRLMLAAAGRFERQCEAMRPGAARSVLILATTLRAARLRVSTPRRAARQPPQGHHGHSGRQRDSQRLRRPAADDGDHRAR